jgi:translation initiation factor IF-3
MEIIGKIKVLNETQSIGDKGFRKREVVITTQEQYPQHILVEFTQDKCELLNDYCLGQEVKISLNLRGREWVNPEGITKYFNSIQGWRIEPIENQEATPFKTTEEEQQVSFIDNPDNDLPF